MMYRIIAATSSIQRSRALAIGRRTVQASSLFSSYFHSTNQIEQSSKENNNNVDNNTVRLSKLISQYGVNMQMSRKSAEALISLGQVTIAGEVVTNPAMKIDLDNNNRSGDRLYYKQSIKVAGRLFILDEGGTTSRSDNSGKLASNTAKDSPSASGDSSNTVKQIQPLRTRVWIAHKLKGELVAEHDPMGRPSLMERLYRGGVGKPKKPSKNKSRMHLKPVGRLDMMTEGLILITNDGSYVREMTLPSNQIQRTYRVRVHGRITQQKLKTIRNGLNIDGTYYKGMNVHLELNKSSSRAKGGNTNTWLRITCTEGKNRMIRKVFDHLGLQVTRLIRISFGDYDLNTIPPGLAIEVPVKPIEKQKKKGSLNMKQKSFKRNRSSGNEKDSNSENKATPVEWVRHG